MKLLVFSHLEQAKIDQLIILVFQNVSLIKILKCFTLMKIIIYYETAGFLTLRTSKK